MSSITDSMIRDFYTSLPSVPHRNGCEDTQPLVAPVDLDARQDGQPGGDGGGGGSPATIAAPLPAEHTPAATTAAMFTRASQHDLRGLIDADAWKHADCGERFFTLPGAVPTSCPRCEFLVSEEEARQTVQRDLCGQFLLAHYHDDPAGFLAKFDSWCYRTQAAVTRACAGFLGVSCEEVDHWWVDSRLRAAELGMLS